MSKEKTKNKKGKVAIIPKKKTEAMIEPYRPTDLWSEFDRTFDRFRRDFENILWPAEYRESSFPVMRRMETRMRAVDLEDKGDKYIMSVDAPGYSKDDIEINVWDGSIEVSGCRETKKDEDTEGYVRKERSSESFYRRMELPEEIKTESAEANLKDGVLELVLPKKTPKMKKKVQVK